MLIRLLIAAAGTASAFKFLDATVLQRGWKAHRFSRCTASATHDAHAPIDAAQDALQPMFAQIDAATERSLQRVLDAFRHQGIGSHHFAGVDGYGHGDIGRDAIDALYAELFGAEAALVRVQFFSGTHAIACALFGSLRPGDELLAVSGAPYDTLEEVIGLRGRTNDGLRGTLADFGVTYSQVELLDEGTFDLPAIDAAIGPKTRMLHVQRSCGYAWRPSIQVSQIGRLAEWLEANHPSIVLFVDNCYGEFVEPQEPCQVGAHLVAGSLIKNPGGTLAPSGGYVAGRRDLVDAAARRLSAPGVAGGATLGLNRAIIQGLFNAPGVVGEALKGACLVARVMEDLGYRCNPPSGQERTDIIQAVELGSREKVLAFCEAVQRCSPIGAHIVPVPGVTPGYGDEVIFADGTFIDGSTLELSADGPLREPFAVYVQGATHWTHWSIVLREVLADARMAGPASRDAPASGGDKDEDDAERSRGRGKAQEAPRRYAGRRTLRNS